MSDDWKDRTRPLKYNLPLIRERLTAAGIAYEPTNDTLVRVLVLRGDGFWVSMCWYDDGADFSLDYSGRSQRGMLDAARLALPVIDMVEAP